MGDRKAPTPWDGSPKPEPPPAPPAKRIANEMNPTAAEIRREYGHALAMIAEQAETIRQLQAQIAEHDGIVEALGERATRLQQRIATLTQERDEARSQASLLSTAKAEIIDDLEARCATLTAALEELRRESIAALESWTEVDRADLFIRERNAFGDLIDRAALAAAPQGQETPDPQKGAPTP